MPNQDLTVACRYHASGMPFEELHIEVAFDLAQQFRGGRLGESRCRGGSRQGGVLTETDQQGKLARLQAKSVDGSDAAHGRDPYWGRTVPRFPQVEIHVQTTP